jgi:hypothetical protein
MTQAETTLKNILNFTISDGKQKLPCLYEASIAESKNCLMLFLTGNDNPPIAVGTKVRVSLHSREVEVASKHSTKSTAEDVCFRALELLGINRQLPYMSLFLRNSSPIYKGMDQDGSHVYSFKLLMRGKK